eukprot:Nk52_evm27s1967 gene=Nk52_evmTU27s1967
MEELMKRLKGSSMTPDERLKSVQNIWNDDRFFPKKQKTLCEYMIRELSSRGGTYDKNAQDKETKHIYSDERYWDLLAVLLMGKDGVGEITNATHLLNPICSILNLSVARKEFDLKLLESVKKCFDLLFADRKGGPLPKYENFTEFMASLLKFSLLFLENTEEETFVLLFLRDFLKIESVLQKRNPNHKKIFVSLVKGGLLKKCAILALLDDERFDKEGELCDNVREVLLENISSVLFNKGHLGDFSFLVQGALAEKKGQKPYHLQLFEELEGGKDESGFVISEIYRLKALPLLLESFLKSYAKVSGSKKQSSLLEVDASEEETVSADLEGQNDEHEGEAENNDEIVEPPSKKMRGVMSESKTIQFSVFVRFNDILNGLQTINPSSRLNCTALMVRLLMKYEVYSVSQEKSRNCSLEKKWLSNLLERVVADANTQSTLKETISVFSCIVEINFYLIEPHLPALWRVLFEVGENGEDVQIYIDFCKSVIELYVKLRKIQFLVESVLSGLKLANTNAKEGATTFIPNYILELLVPSVCGIAMAQAVPLLKVSLIGESMLKTKELAPLLENSSIKKKKKLPKKTNAAMGLFRGREVDVKYLACVNTLLAKILTEFRIEYHHAPMLLDQCQALVRECVFPFFADKLDGKLFSSESVKSLSCLISSIFHLWSCLEYVTAACISVLSSSEDMSQQRLEAAKRIERLKEHITKFLESSLPLTGTLFYSLVCSIKCILSLKPLYNVGEPLIEENSLVDLTILRMSCLCPSFLTMQDEANFGRKALLELSVEDACFITSSREMPHILNQSSIVSEEAVDAIVKAIIVTPTEKTTGSLSVIPILSFFSIRENQLLRKSLLKSILKCMCSLVKSNFSVAKLQKLADMAYAEFCDFGLEDLFNSQKKDFKPKVTCAVMNCLSLLSSYNVEFVSEQEKFVCFRIISVCLYIACYNESSSAIDPSQELLKGCLIELGRLVQGHQTTLALSSVTYFLQMSQKGTIMLPENELALESFSKYVCCSFSSFFKYLLKTNTNGAEAALQHFEKTAPMFLSITSQAYKESVGCCLIKALCGVLNDALVLNEKDLPENEAIFVKSVVERIFKASFQTVCKHAYSGNRDSLVELMKSENDIFTDRGTPFVLETSASLLHLQEAIVKYKNNVDKDFENPTDPDDWSAFHSSISRVEKQLREGSAARCIESPFLSSYVSFLKSFWSTFLLFGTSSVSDYTCMIEYLLNVLYPAVLGSKTDSRVVSDFVQAMLFTCNPEQFALFLKQIRVHLSECSGFSSNMGSLSGCVVSIRCLKMVLQSKSSSWKRRLLKNVLVPFCLRLSVILQEAKSVVWNEYVIKEIVTPSLQCISEIAQTESVNFSSRDISLVLESVSVCPSFRAETNEELCTYLELSAGIYTTLFMILRKHSEKTIEIFHSFIGCIRSMLVSIAFHLRLFKITDVGQTERSGMKLAIENLARLFEEMAGNKKSISKYAPYILSDCVYHFHNFSVSDTFRDSLLSGMYVLVDSCGEHELMLMFSSLDNSSKETFKGIHNSYKKYHEYKGKM